MAEHLVVDEISPVSPPIAPLARGPKVFEARRSPISHGHDVVKCKCGFCQLYPTNMAVGIPVQESLADLTHSFTGKGRKGRGMPTMQVRLQKLSTALSEGNFRAERGLLPHTGMPS